ncbi:MAG: hypothetical protein ABIJ83_04930 [Patescibacteria group bacterium]
METAQQFIKRKENQFQEDLKKNKKISMKDIGRKTKMFFIREAWTFMVQSNLDKKVFMVERLKKHEVDKEKLAYPESWDVGAIEYRISYWIVGQIGNKQNKWTFGSFCPIIPEKDFDKLINQAKKEKTIK